MIFKQFSDYNILSLDPGYNSTGYFMKFILASNPFLYGTIYNKLDYSEAVFYEHFFSNLNTLLFSIKFLIIEMPAFSRFGISRSISKIMELRGIIKYICYKNNVKIIEIQSTMWKNVIENVYGIKVPSQSKKNKYYIKMINEKFNMKFNTDDECDAFLMYIAVKNIYEKKYFTEAQEKFCKNIKKILDK